MPPMLEVNDLDAYYGDSQVVSDVSFSIAAGQGVALLGRNGAGKTTLIRGLLGNGVRTEGTIRLADRDVSKLPDYKRIKLGLSVVPEDRRIFAHLTVRDNLLIARKGARPDVTPMELDEVFDLFPLLRDLRYRFGDQLSGGQQQILAVARGMVCRPKCLLLDEPSEGVAPIIVQQMMEQISKALHTNGSAMLLTEQNIEFARGICEYVFIIDSGRIVYSGSWSDLDRSEGTVKRYLGV